MKVVFLNSDIVFEYENDIYRPSQANVNGIYGNGLNINKISVFTPYTDQINQSVVEYFKKENICNFLRLN